MSVAVRGEEFPGNASAPAHIRLRVPGVTLEATGAPASIMGFAIAIVLWMATRHVGIYRAVTSFYLERSQMILNF